MSTLLTKAGIDAKPGFFFFFILLAFCIFFWSQFTSYTAMKTAYQGYSPIELVNKHVMPANFLRDFPSGTDNYRKSAFIHVYIVAYRYFGLEPEAMIPVVMAFEIGLIAWTIWFLTRTLFPHAPAVAAYLAILLFLGSYLKELDLGRVGVYLEGKVNNVGDMLRMLAIAFTLRGKLVPAGAMLGLSFITNPLMSLIGGVFILAGLAVEPKRIIRSETLLGGGLFIAVSAFWIYLMYDAANFSGALIPADTWFAISRMSSYHWFPAEYGLFTTLHEERFIPLLSFSILFLYCLPRPLRDADRMVLAGTVAMAMLIAIGAIGPTLDISQTLVKLNLVRADEILIAIGLIYIVLGLLSEISSGTIARTAVASALLVSPFLIQPGFPLLLTLLLVVPSLLQRDIRQWTAGERYAAVISFLTVSVMVIYVFAGWAGSFWSPAYSGGKLLLGLVAVFAVIGVIRKFTIPQSRPAVMVVMLFLIASLASVHWVIRQKPADAYVHLAGSYKQVQEWARDNSPVGSLFMIDPTIYYGWREFSQRSSFGNLREWTYNWANSNDYETYREGMKRFGEFGTPLEPYLRYMPPVQGFSALEAEVGKRYHQADDGWRVRLAARYNIDYFVMDKNKMSAPLAESGDLFERVYENRDFVVLRLRAEE